MKTKTLYILLALCAALSAVLGALPAVVSEAFSSLVAFPFEQIALALRWLSLSGGAGNAAAIIIYVVLCLLPTVLALPAIIKKRHGEDVLIPFLSLVLFGAVYFMINPALLTGSYGMGFAAMTRAMLGGGCWCVIISWLVLKIVRFSRESGRESVEKYLRICITAAAFAFVAVAFGGGVSGFAAALDKLQEGNSGGLVNTTPTVAFLVLQAVVGALPNVMDALVAVKGAQLLRAIGEDRYSAETVEKAENLAAFSIFSIKLTVMVSLAFNLLQLLFIKQLLVMAVEVVLPLASLMFMLSAMLLSRFLRENKALKDDNDLFI